MQPPSRHVRMFKNNNIFVQYTLSCPLPSLLCKVPVPNLPFTGPLAAGVRGLPRRGAGARPYGPVPADPPRCRRAGFRRQGGGQSGAVQQWYYCVM